MYQLTSKETGVQHIVPDDVHQMLVQSKRIKKYNVLELTKLKPVPIEISEEVKPEKTKKQ